MLDAKAPWPLLDGRLDQRDERLKIRPALAPYGCAFMLTCEIGRYLADRPPWTPLQIVGLYDVGVKLGAIRKDAYIEDWDKIIDLAAGYNAVDYLGHKPGRLSV